MQHKIIDILKKLVSFESITPNSAGAIEYCSEFLSKLGFECEILKFGNVSNLYAKFGNFEKNFCFAGHVDVVPPLDGWRSDPFELKLVDEKCFGRGTNDMKGPLASCLLAVSDFLNQNTVNFSISFILTSDEEIMGTNGTRKVVDFLKQRGEKITACVLCESCSPAASGEYIKIGCRGSLNVDLKSSGKQCHVASTDKFGNHLNKFISLLNKIADLKFDDGNENFSPTNLEITSVDVGNIVRNIVPAKISAKMNIRFNDEWNFDTLEDFVRSNLYDDIEVGFERFGTPFVGASEKFTNFLKNSVKCSIGKNPEVGTSGGNSDAVSLRELSDVVEIGSPLENAHTIDEYITIADLAKLYKIYFNLMTDFAEY